MKNQGLIYLTTYKSSGEKLTINICVAYTYCILMWLAAKKGIAIMKFYGLTFVDEWTALHIICENDKTSTYEK